MTSRRRSLLGLGKLYRHTGKRDRAQDHLTIATTLYREMDMQFWLQQAAVETGALGRHGGEVHAPLLTADEVIDP